MKSIRDWGGAALFLVACCALLYWFSGGAEQDELTRTRRVYKPTAQDTRPLPTQPEPPVKMATCCKPKCKSPDKCDEKSCVCTRNAGPALPPGKDAGAGFMLIVDPGPIEPGDPPSCSEDSALP